MQVLLSVAQVIGKRILIQGFIVSDYMSTMGPQFSKEMSQVWSFVYSVAFCICIVSTSFYIHMSTLHICTYDVGPQTCITLPLTVFCQACQTQCMGS